MMITFPLPPTDNHLYGHHGRIKFMTAEGKEWKESAGWIAKSAKLKYTEGDVVIGEIHIYIKFPRDIQGTLKLMFDSLEGILYKNDKQIVKFGAVFKHKDKLNPRIELFL